MVKSLTVDRLRADAIRRTFFPPTTLKAAIRRIGFVQADPIRSPARAQDLILRHRVKDYHAGDLERRYPKLDVEEDLLYAYGFMPREVWQLLHPREVGSLDPFQRRVLDVVIRNGKLHPKELEAELGRERIVNYWGGYSKATTRALHILHHRGLLRIVGRENGIRLYQGATPISHSLAPEERLKQVILLVTRIFAPAIDATVISSLRAPRSVFSELLKSGELDSAEVEGVRYVWPAGKIVAAAAPPVVRILAPFDPLVWDRRRFEHFWGWPYRFEAYTPPKKRVRGYYAMPLLWGANVVGWANVSKSETEVGFAAKPIRDRAFRRALDDELDRMRVFLAPPAS